MFRRSRAMFLVAAALALAAAACGDDKSSTSSAGASGGDTAGGKCAAAGATGLGTGGTAIGFIFVGPKDDFGYNQAAYEGAKAVEKACTDFKVLTAENVPEDDNATRTMEDMISKGAKIIFATSYGHLDPALKVAAANPAVAVVQHGNLIKGPIPPNAWPYLGTGYAPRFLPRLHASYATTTHNIPY